MTDITTIDRATANRLNPFIGEFGLVDTINVVKDAVTALGSLLTIPEEAVEINTGPLYFVFITLTAALAYEQERLMSKIPDGQP